MKGEELSVGDNCGNKLQMVLEKCGICLKSEESGSKALPLLFSRHRTGDNYTLT